MLPQETESKDKLAQAICQHFMSFEVDEQDVMGNFFQAAKRIRSTTF